MHRFDALRTASPLSTTSPSNTTTSTIGKQATLSPTFSNDIPLVSSWTAWCMTKPSPLSTAGNGSVAPASSNGHQQHAHQVKPNLTNYEQAIMPVSRFDTVDSFCAIYSRLTRPSSAPTPMPTNNDLHVFREGIKPLWEDPHNVDGGKLVLRLRKGLAARLWEHLLVALIDHDSPLYVADRTAQAAGAKKAAPIEPGKICGVVLSVRHQEDIVSMWCKHRDERDAEPLREALLKVLCLPSTTLVEFKTHDASLKDRSSYRNTSKYRT